MEENRRAKRARRLWLLPVGAVLLCGAAALAWEVWGAAWLLPRIAAEIEAASGLSLAADGPVAARLLPRIGMHVAGVRLTPGHSGEARPLLYADAADVDLSWAALLRGETRLRRLRLVRSRVLAEPLQPPIDMDIAAEGPRLDAVLSSGDADARVAAHRDGDTLVLDRVAVEVAGLGEIASGSGRLSLRDPIRLVLNAGLKANAPLGSAAVALTYSTDGLVLERADWRRPDGVDVTLFGHAAAEAGKLRFEGGLGLSSESDSRFDASAAFDGTFDADGLSVTIGQIDVRTGTSRLTGDAKLRGGDAARLAASLHLDRLDLSTLKQSPLAPLAAELAGTATTADAGLHLRIDRLTTGDTSIADGIVVDVARHAGTFDLHELAVRSLAGAPLWVGGRLTFGPGPIGIADDLHLRYGQTEAAGRLRFDVSGLRPRLDGEISTGPLHLDGLFAGPPPLPPPPVPRRVLAAPASARPAAAVSPQKLPPLPAAFPVDADIAVASPRIAWRHYRLDDVRARLDIREHELAISDLTAAALGGKVLGTARVEQAAQPRVDAELHLSGADLGAILSEAGIDSIAARADIRADLAARGDSIAALVNTLAGTVTVTARDGVLTGFDLAILSDHLRGRLRRPADILQLARFAAGGRTPFAALQGDFRIDGGVARTDDLRLTAATGAAHARGSIDLSRRTVDLVNEVQVTDPPAVPPLVVKLNGPWSAPRRVFDFSRLQSYLLHRRDAAAPAAR